MRVGVIEPSGCSATPGAGGMAAAVAHVVDSIRTDA
jgi:hypothetical protein